MPLPSLSVWLIAGLALALFAAPLGADEPEAKPAEGAPPPGGAGGEGAAGEAGAPAGDKLEIPFTRYTLDNGLEVLMHEDHRTPFVAVSVWYHVGAFDEAKGKTGFAHLFEHLMFQGTPNVGDDKHIAYLEEAGASIRAGMVNGTTNEDRTNYFEVLPSNELELALWLESDRMGYLMDGVTQAKLDEQRAVVKNERLQSVENRPYGLADEALWQKMFPPEHPYYGMVIGSLEDLDKATLEDVAGFYDTYYAPSNATLCVAGDIQPEEAKALIAKYFGTLPPWDKPVAKTVEAPSLSAPIRVDYAEPIGKLPLVKISWFTPALFQPGDAELDVASFVLASGKSSKLYRSLVDEMQIAQSVNAYQQSMGNVSVFSIEIVVRDGKDPEEALTTAMAHVEEMQFLPPEQSRIEQAVNTIETSKVLGLQKIGSFGGKAEQLQSYNHYLKKPGWLAEDLARYRAVTPESIGEVLQKYLTADKRAVLVAIPKPPEAPAPAEGAAAEGAATEGAAAKGGEG